MNHRSFQTGLLVLALLAITTAVYWPGLGGPFLFDDYPNLRNTELESLDWAAVKDATLSNRSGMLLRPVANLSFALNGYFSDDDPFGYKLVNLNIHLLAGVLVFFLVRALAQVASGNGGGARATTAGLIAAGIWLLHPLQLSTVLYIVQRMAQLSALFALLAVLAWVKWRRSLNSRQPARTLVWIPLTALCMALSILSKENGALIPLFLLVVELTLFRMHCVAYKRTPLYIGNALLIALPLLAGVVYTLVNWQQFMGGYAIRPFSLFERLLTEVHAVWHYLGLILVPSLADMGLYLDDFPIQHGLDFVTVFLGLGLAAMILGALVLRRRFPVLSLGVLWFFAAHALESTFIPLELVFEHRNYLALMGPALIAGYYVPVLIRSAGRLKRPALIGIVLIGLFLPALTALRAQSWSSRLAFTKTHLAHHPDSFRLQIGLISAAMNADNVDGAFASVDRIEKNYPNDPSVPLLRILLGCRTGQVPDAWITESVRRIQSQGVNKRAIMSLRVLTDLSIKEDCASVGSAQTIALINVALDAPVIRDGSRLKALLLLNRARLHAKFDSVAQAARDYHKAWQTDSAVLTPLYDLFYLYLAVDRFDEARQTLDMIDQAIQSRPFGVGRATLQDLELRFKEECRADASCEVKSP